MKHLINAIGLLLKTIIWIMATITMNSCSDSNNDDRRTAEETMLLDSITNGTTNLEPWAGKACENQMKMAKDSLTYYDYLTLKARHFIFTNTPESTLVYSQRINQFLNQLQPTPRVSGMKALAAATEASYYYLLKTDPERVIELNTKAYELAQNSDISTRLPDMAANLADAYVADNDFASGSRWYKRALFLVDSLNLPQERNITLYLGLAQIYSNSRDFAAAKKYYDLVDLQYDNMKPNMQTYFLNNYGNYLYFTENYKAAHDMFMRMMRHLEDHQDNGSFDMYLCKINLADVMLNLGNADSANVLVNEVEPFFKKHDVKPALFYVNTIRLGIATIKGDNVSAQRVINSNDDSIQVEDGLKRIRNKYLGKYYLAQGDYRNAYKNLRTEKTMNDSILTTEMNNRASAIINQLTEDTLKLHHKLEMEEKNAEVVLSRVGITTMFAVAISLACAAGLVLAHSRKRQLQMHVDLMELRLANARQRISPHFIFNLLNADLAKVGSEEAKQLLSISQLMRNSLELVHQSYVPLNEELKFVNHYVQLYRSMLGNNFEYSLNVPDSNEIENVMIPPMIVQILVENAIKHGLKRLEEEKKLSLSINCNEEQTIITVEDNGPGMDMSHSLCHTPRSGLYIIRHTINYINHYNRSKRMVFSISNQNREDGSIAGCIASLYIPHGMKYPEINNE